MLCSGQGEGQGQDEDQGQEVRFLEGISLVVKTEAEMLIRDKKSEGKDVPHERE